MNSKILKHFANKSVHRPPVCDLWSGDLEGHTSRVTAVADKGGLKGTSWRQKPTWSADTQVRPEGHHPDTSSFQVKSGPAGVLALGKVPRSSRRSPVRSQPSLR